MKIIRIVAMDKNDAPLHIWECPYEILKDGTFGVAISRCLRMALEASNDVRITRKDKT